VSLEAAFYNVVGDALDRIEAKRIGCREELLDTSASCAYLDRLWVLKSEIFSGRNRRM
jgi:hypothetical protein